MLKVRYVLGACLLAVAVSGWAHYGSWKYCDGENTYGYCGSRTLLYCQDGICYYTDGASFTNPDGTHVISQSGVTPQ